MLIRGLASRGSAAIGLTDVGLADHGGAIRAVDRDRGLAGSLWREPGWACSVRWASTGWERLEGELSPPNRSELSLML
jgi:hypothetical protein